LQITQFAESQIDAGHGKYSKFEEDQGDMRFKLSGTWKGPF
jgi:hypothetical protein